MLIYKHSKEDEYRPEELQRVAERVYMARLQPSFQL